MTGERRGPPRDAPRGLGNPPARLAALFIAHVAASVTSVTGGLIVHAILDPAVVDRTGFLLVAVAPLAVPWAFIMMLAQVVDGEMPHRGYLCWAAAHVGVFAAAYTLLRRLRVFASAER